MTVYAALIHRNGLICSDPSFSEEYIWYLAAQQDNVLMIHSVHLPKFNI